MSNDCDHRHDHGSEQDSRPHSHSGHGHSHAAQGSIGWAFFLNLFFCLFELVGALRIGSLTIMAGAIHDIGDSITLGCAWYLERFSNRKEDQRFNFGYRRFSLLSSVIAGFVIVSGAIAVCIHSVQSLQTSTHAPAPLPMIGFAVVGLLVNGLAAWKLGKGHTQNEKVLTWHLIEDVMNWAGVLLGAIVIYWTDAAWVDPALAILLSVFVIYHLILHVKESVLLFLQARPNGFDQAIFEEKVCKIPGVERMQKLRIWSLDGVENILSCQILLKKDLALSELVQFKNKIQQYADEQGHFEIAVDFIFRP